jgi:hypothetical protein
VCQHMIIVLVSVRDQNSWELLRPEICQFGWHSEPIKCSSWGGLQFGIDENGIGG